jgi:predicted Zn finger-like uncharacterized protein
MDITCPGCRKMLRVPEEMVGKKVRCPSCNEVFEAQADSGGAPPGPPPGFTPAPPREEERGYPERRPPEDEGRRGREGEFADRPRGRSDEDYDRPRGRPDDDYDRPRRRDDEDYPARPRRSEALGMVSGPATALMVVGGIGIALGLLNIVMGALGVSMAGGGGAGGPGGPGGQGDPTANMIGGICGGLWNIAWSGLIIAGATKMKKLESFGLAMTASIMAMIPGCGCCLLGLPFGIWALVVLNKPEVKSSFH